MKEKQTKVKIVVCFTLSYRSLPEPAISKPSFYSEQIHDKGCHTQKEGLQITLTI